MQRMLHELVAGELGLSVAESAEIVRAATVEALLRCAFTDHFEQHVGQA